MAEGQASGKTDEIVASLPIEAQSAIRIGPTVMRAGS